jgi:hypothetical protein
MVSPKVYETLDSDERKLWHSHEYEVKSGMLIMPSPLSTSGIPVPTAIWEQAENAAMKEVIGWYGKTYHFWQVDRGDKLPLGMPKLMGSFTEKESLPLGFDQALEARDKRYGSDCRHKEEIRKDILSPELHPGKSSHGLSKSNVVGGKLTLERRCRHAKRQFCSVKAIAFELRVADDTRRSAAFYTTESRGMVRRSSLNLIGVWSGYCWYCSTKAHLRPRGMASRFHASATSRTV